MRKRIKKGVACVLCASMVAALLGGCSSKNAESSKPSIHIESYTKVGYDTVTVQSGDISPILNLKLSPASAMGSAGRRFVGRAVSGAALLLFFHPINLVV